MAPLSMTSSPQITVILPTHQRPRLLRRALESVHRQSYPHYQIKIYDNASRDETPQIASLYGRRDPRVQYHRHPQNIGSRQNFLFGLKTIDTPFFSVLPDDDVLFPDFFETTMRGFEKFPQAQFSGGVCLVMDPNGGILQEAPSSWRKKEGIFEPPQGLFEMLGRGLYRHPVITSFLFRKEILKKIGRPEATEGLPWDMDYLLKAAAQTPFYFARKPFSVYFLRSESEYAAKPIGVRYAGLKKMMIFFDKKCRLPPPVKKRALLLMRQQRGEAASTLAVKAFLKRRFHEVSQMSEVLEKEFGQIRKSALLRKAVEEAHHHPQKHLKLFQWLNRVLLRPVPKKGLRKRYGNYVKLLNY